MTGRRADRIIIDDGPHYDGVMPFIANRDEVERIAAEAIRRGKATVWSSHTLLGPDAVPPQTPEVSLYGDEPLGEADVLDDDPNGLYGVYEDDEDYYPWEEL